jgi:hypothetical protein
MALCVVRGKERSGRVRLADAATSEDRRRGRKANFARAVH